MAQGSGRISCPRCGSNNFDTVTVCWKCNSPLSGGAPGAPQPAYAAAAPPAYASPAPQLAAAERFAPLQAAAANVAAGINYGNPAAANRAAIWLGLLMPYFGLPIGLAFMMCDDRRRQEVGRICVLWSVLSGVVHLLFTIVGLLGMRQWLFLALGVARSQLNRPGGMGGGLNGLD